MDVMDDLIGILLAIGVVLGFMFLGYHFGKDDTLGDAKNKGTLIYESKVYNVTLDSNKTMKLLWEKK